MLECEPGKLGRLLGRQLLSGSRTCPDIDNERKSSPAIGKPGDHKRDRAGMAAAKCCVDRTDNLQACGTLRGGEQLQLGRVDRRNGSASCFDSVPLRLEDFSGFAVLGLSVFRGSLARPFQGSRYWSRSQPLSRSRSFQ